MHAHTRFSKNWRNYCRRISLSLAASIFYYLGLSWLFFQLNRGRKRIITYHNVLPDRQFDGALHQGVSHSEYVFKRQIAYLRRLFPCDTNLDNRNSLTVTFDDGYLNQYEIAHRILASIDMRAYFFCSLSLLETHEPLLTDRLLCWLSYAPCGVYTLPSRNGGSELTLVINSDADRHFAWTKLNERLLSGSVTERMLMDMLDACIPFTAIRAMVPTETYSLRFTPIPEEALAEMRAFGHLIGPHGQSHQIMASMDDDSLNREVQMCAAQLGVLFNTTTFSYPYGGEREVTPRVVSCVESQGFKRAVSNIDIPLNRELQYSNMFLPRMTLPNSADHQLLFFIVSGAKYFLQHHRLLPSYS